MSPGDPARTGAFLSGWMLLFFSNKSVVSRQWNVRALKALVLLCRDVDSRAEDDMILGHQQASKPGGTTDLHAAISMNKLIQPHDKWWNEEAF